MKGLSDPVVNLSMGQTAEILAQRFAISRAAMDVFALESHRRCAAAQDAGQVEDRPVGDGMAFDQQQARRIARPRGPQGDAVLGKLEIELIDAHQPPVAGASLG